MKLLSIMVVLLCMAADANAMLGLECDVVKQGYAVKHERGFTYTKTEYTRTYRSRYDPATRGARGTVKLDVIEIMSPKTVKRVFIDSFSTSDLNVAIWMVHDFMKFIKTLGSVEAILMCPDRCGYWELQKALERLSYKIELGERFYVIS